MVNYSNEKAGILMPGYKTSTYRIVLMPHLELRKKLMKVRQEFAEKYEVRQYPRAAFITLAKFDLFAMMEKRIIQKLESIAMTQQPFMVAMKDYGSYPDHSVFINISNSSRLKILSKEIQALRPLIKSVNTKPFFIRDFNLQLASGLKPWQFEKGWQDYQKRSFTGSFYANEVLLLKHHGNSPELEILSRFEFRNIPVQVQGELF